MGAPIQYTFELLEIGKLLLKKENIRDGLWTVGVQFIGTPAEAGLSPEAVRPSMILSVDRFLLTKVDVKTPLTIDAASLS